MLIFAVYRNFELCKKVHDDVCSLAKPEVVYYLNNIKRMFENCSMYDMSWANDYIYKALLWLNHCD